MTSARQPQRRGRRRVHYGVAVGALAAALGAGLPAGASEVGVLERTLLHGGWWWLLWLVPAAAAIYLLSRRRAAQGERGARTEEAAPADDGPVFSREAFRHLMAAFEDGLARAAHGDQRLESTYIEVLGAMVTTAHARDHETIGHSFRVARYAVTLAQRMGLERETLTAIEWGALLHDVGKTAVPEDVLRKSGPLSAEEREVMQLHPRQGYQMLRELVFLGTALDVVLSHHERWDGKGYPNGLAAEQIPLSARIFAVVDTYDAITSDRPYRAAQEHGVAIAELRRVAGRQLDPEVVAAFLEIPEEELLQLRDLTRPVPSGVDAASHRTAFEDPEAGFEVLSGLKRRTG